MSARPHAATDPARLIRILKGESANGQHDHTPHPDDGPPMDEPFDGDPHSDTSPGPVIITAADLMRKEFPEPRWAVPGIFPEGMTLLVGSPKLGKSWLGLNVAVAIALGGRAVGKIPVDQGDVLYLALEDTERRLQERLETTLQGHAAPSSLHITTAWPTLADGGMAHLRAWLASHPGARLVIIDTFQKIRGPVGTNQNLYAGDYSAAGEIKRVADQYGVAVVLVHHTRKAEAADPLDMVSGTNGLAGAVDTICVLKREVGRHDATLYLRGRDVPEADHALSFDPATCIWTLLGDATEYRTSEGRKAIIDLLRDAPEPMSPKAIADALGTKPNNTRYLLHRMVKDGEVVGIGGAYRLPFTFTNTPNESNTNNTPNTPNTQSDMSLSVRGVRGSVRGDEGENGANPRTKHKSVRGVSGEGEAGDDQYTR
jgi:hypothetical protein